MIIFKFICRHSKFGKMAEASKYQVAFITILKQYGSSVIFAEYHVFVLMRQFAVPLQPCPSITC